MKYTIPDRKTLFRGKVSVRDYVVLDCISKGKKLSIHYRGDVMTLNPDQLRGFTTNYKEFESKIDGKLYTLYDYNWNPNGKGGNH